MKLSKKFFVLLYVICFITLYFIFLIFFYLPLRYDAPIILLSGFGLFIIGFFYFFFFIIKDKENNIILRFLKVIDYLKTKNIPYLILSKEPTSFNVEAEKYIDIYGELIPFFYKNKLYEYKSLTIYCSN